MFVHSSILLHISSTRGWYTKKCKIKIHPILCKDNFHGQKKKRWNLVLQITADFQGTNFFRLYLAFFFIYGIIIVVSVIEHMFTSSSFLITLTNHSTLVIVVCTSQKGQYISLYWTCMNSQQRITKIAVTSDSHPMYTYRN